ncbi:FAD binding domain-containing protein [Massarina eburnea CBS 473.64]|uniref:FAD binding domain-containing protein n=1 Tax=Massarina eburnea CBS 473.64 TaxID=1395130 RepID=A0A6A6S872_9PLEO|nr:FAD binding domain-containing protein [Massarina eburnea CBS 473.64]
MKVLTRTILSLLFLAVAETWAQYASPLEGEDFDVVEALLNNGVNVLEIPTLASLATRSNSTNACSIACSSLRFLFGSSNVNVQGSPGYDSFTSLYWSVQQEEVEPYCIFKPSKNLDVSTVVLLSRLTQCPFAVKSGGHAAFAGSSSIQGGITVALENLKGLTLSSDKRSASIEPGNLWYDVYTKLESHNLTVIGGRVAGIGVGGLTLGGGISFFSNQYGWTCDNIQSFEVVTASGIIVTASPTNYPDLYWALRGGGNNFGIVTKFNLKTISQGLMWGGSRIHLEDQFPAVINAFYNLGVNSAQDTAAAQITSFAYTQNTRLASADLQYAKPIANASIFSEYLAIPSLQDTTKVRSLADLTVQFNSSNPDGLRETYWAMTFKLDKDLVSYVKDVFYDELAAITDAEGLVAAATMQVITVPQLQNMVKNGGNALGLSASSGPLLLVNPNMMWTNIADDTRILKANSNLVKRTVAEANTRGLAVDYIYMNYASQFQAVVPSYGASNQARLKAVAKKYDPVGVFQTLQPGYFKLDGAPDPNMP